MTEDQTTTAARPGRGDAEPGPARTGLLREHVTGHGPATTAPGAAPIPDTDPPVTVIGTADQPGRRAEPGRWPA